MEDKNYLNTNTNTNTGSGPGQSYRNDDAPTQMSTGEIPANTPDKFIDPQTGDIRLQALVDSYLAMEKKLSSMVAQPTDDDMESRDRIFDMLGRPNSANEYDIDLSHGLFMRDGDCDQCMYDKGFTNDQAQLVYDLAAKKIVPMIMEMAGEFQADREIERLIEKFGGPERWREMARQLNAYGSKNLPKDVLDGLASSYEGVMALYRMMQRDEPNIIPTLDGPAGDQEGDLQAMIRDPRYWKHKDPQFIKKVTQGFRQVYGQS